MCSWQCGGCGKWYSFAVQSCDCSKYIHIETSTGGSATTPTNTASAKCQCGAEAVYHYCRICWCMEIDSQKQDDTSPVQQLKAEIRSVVDDFVCIPPVRITQEIDNLIYKLRELSAV